MMLVVHIFETSYSILKSLIISEESPDERAQAGSRG